MKVGGKRWSDAGRPGATEEGGLGPLAGVELKVTEAFECMSEEEEEEEEEVGMKGQGSRSVRGAQVDNKLSLSSAPHHYRLSICQELSGGGNSF